MSLHKLKLEKVLADDSPTTTASGDRTGFSSVFGPSLSHVAWYDIVSDFDRAD